MTSASFTEAELTRSVAPIEQINGVRGICLARKSTVLLNRIALPKDRFELLSEIMDGMIQSYSQQGRNAMEIVLGYDGGNVALIALKDYRLLILHSNPEDTDEVCRTGHFFLDDLDRIERGQAAKTDQSAAISRSDLQLKLPEVWRSRALTDEQLAVDPTSVNAVAEAVPDIHVDRLPEEAEADATNESLAASEAFPKPQQPEKFQETAPQPPVLKEADEFNLSWEQYRKELTRILGKVMNRSTVTMFLNHELKTKHAIYGEQPSPLQFEEIGYAVSNRIPDRIKRERIRSELSDLLDRPQAEL